MEGSRPEGIARTPRHEPRQIGLPSDHFRRGAPVRPLLFLGHPLDAQPLETDAPDPDAIADGPIVRLDEVEIALARRPAGRGPILFGRPGTSPMITPCGPLPHGSGGHAMIGQSFTLVGCPKLVFRIVWRGA
jgi:hypothetical protein